MEIVLQNVGKQFKNGTRALDHVTFTVPQGEFVSVIGPSGAGKTTLFRILNGMETPGDGAVLFDGSDIASMSGTARKNVKRSIGTIYQDFCLVENSTCLANVLTACLPDMGFFPAVFGIYGKERRAEALRFLDRVGLPEKADEPVKNLSGGQKQRLSIARALVRRPRILILDDSTSALDYATDAKLRKAIRELTYHPTTFIVSQRTSSICYADEIIVLDDGEVVGIGNHEQLMEQCPVYQEIHQSQFQDRKEA